MEAVAYGIYLVTLGGCIRSLFWGSSGKKERYNWPLVIVATLIFIFATFDVAFGLRHNLDAFIFYKGAGGPDAEFENISYWVNVMKVRAYRYGVSTPAHMFFRQSTPKSWLSSAMGCWSVSSSHEALCVD